MGKPTSFNPKVSVGDLAPWVQEGVASDSFGAELVPPKADQWFTSRSSGLNLATRSFEPASPALGVVFWIHGVSSHSHTVFATGLGKYLRDQSLAAYMFDLAGHGHSYGHKEPGPPSTAPKGSNRSQIIPDYCDIIGDILQFIDLRISKHAEGTRFVLASLSLGGTYAILTGLELQSPSHPLHKRFSGNFLLAPTLDVSLPPRWVQKCLMPCMLTFAPLTTMFAPNRKGLGHTVFSCEAVCEAEGRDPLAWRTHAANHVAVFFTQYRGSKNAQLRG